MAAECKIIISSKHNATLATTTDLRYVRQGMIGESPLKRGVPGEISKDAIKHVAGSFGSFVEIKQANGDTYEVSRNKHG